MLRRNTTQPENCAQPMSPIPMERFGSMEVGAGKF